MSVVKKGKKWHLAFRPFDKSGPIVNVSTHSETKSEAQFIEKTILRACRTGDYSRLDPDCREICTRMFENRKWKLPAELGEGSERAEENLTLWRAVEIFLKAPEVKAIKTYSRYQFNLKHIVGWFGKDFPLHDMKIKHVQQYQAHRLEQGAAQATAQHEIGTISKIFQLLISYELVEHNPTRGVRKVRKNAQRRAYLSFETVQTITQSLPTWFASTIWTGYYTGMRRGEILNLKRTDVNLHKRIITLMPDDTKEGDWKTIPIHKNLVPILENAMRVQSLKHSHVFLRETKKGLEPLTHQDGQRQWNKICTELGLMDPLPRFHDLRHTWRTNAGRSKMDWMLAERILGHTNKHLSVMERYRQISDEELVQAIDAMTFNHGETSVRIAYASKNSEEIDKKNDGNMTAKRDVRISGNALDRS